MPTMDQAVWANVNVVAGGTTVAVARGELLPTPVSDEELAARALLRIGGAVRTVEVVYTPEELAEQAAARAAAAAATEVQLDVDPAASAGNQTPGAGVPGPPTLPATAGSAPVVVVGSKDDTASRAAATKPAAKNTPAGRPNGKQ